MKRIGILLVGCGYYDGSSPWDIAFILRAIETKGAFPYPFAPSFKLKTVVDHQRNKETKDARYAISESARLIRGEIFKLEDVTPQDIDALILPGGYGNYINFTQKNRINGEFELYDPLKKLIRGMYIRGKPIGAIGYGIFPLGLALGKIGKPIVTPGEETDYIEVLENLGVIFTRVPPDEVVYDEVNNVLTSSGINPDVSILKGAQGIENLVEYIVSAKRVKRSSDERDKTD